MTKYPPFTLMYFLTNDKFTNESDVPDKIDNQPKRSSLSMGLSSTITGLAQGSDGTKDFINIQMRNETLVQPSQTYQLQQGIMVNSVQMSRMIFSYFDATNYK